jgi:ATPase
MPVTRPAKKASWQLASREIEKEISHHVRGPFEVEVVSDSSAVIRVPQKEAAKVIGKDGRRIEQIEKTLGMHIDVRARETTGKMETTKIEETSRHLIIWLEGYSGQAVEVFVGGDLAFTATVGRRGDIRIAKSSEVAKGIQKRIKQGEKVEVRLASPS